MPKISIVVPNYNGGRTIEATLRSILDQHYPSLELIVMDGGSKDNSVEIIKKYEPYLAFWVSERDRGQSDAINRGFARCTGDVVNWLCSDDLLEPGSLATVAQVFQDPTVDWCIGKCRMVFPDRPDEKEMMWPSEEEIPRTAVRNAIPQPSTFWRRRLLRDPAVREELYFTMDQELWCFFLSKQARWVRTDRVLSVAVQDGSNKTRSADYRFYRESDRLFRDYWKGGGPPPTPRWYRLGIAPFAHYADSHGGTVSASMAEWWIRRVGWIQAMWRRVK
jgi:glycosyltransferase involved in cell wall biosynthesis